MSENREIRVKGRAVSRGIGIGKAVCIFGDRRQFLRRGIAESEIDTEIARYKTAVSTALDTFNDDIDRTTAAAGQRAAEVLDSHLMILQDPELEKRVKESITTDLVNLEWAVQHSFDQYSETLKKNTSSQIRETYLDLADVAERLLSALAGRYIPPELEKGAVVATSELRASTLLKLREAEVAGIVTEHGGWTSHSSILAREFGIPCVTGIVQLFGYIRNGAVVAVDGNIGEVVFDPSDASLARLETSSNGKVEVSFPNSSAADEPLQTLDGRRVTLRTNTTSLESYAAAKSKGARGIGLFRSETLIANYGRIPTEDEQTEEYRRIAEATGGDGVRIRTFDIESNMRQKNPALGLRAIRLGLRKTEILIPQLRAILRASYHGNIKIVIPMVTDAGEIAAVREILSRQAQDLEKLGVPIGDPEVGAMIEIPSAALLADQIAAAADFLCLGTNDLAQYILAADRDNETVSDWFRTLHPAMLRTVRSVIEASLSANKQFIVCGEMAGSPFYVPILIGMGAAELSVGPASIEPVRRVAAGIAFEEAAELVREVFTFSSPDDVERAVAQTAKAKWLHLYPSGFFEKYGR